MYNSDFTSLLQNGDKEEKNRKNREWYWRNRDDILRRRKETGFNEKQKQWRDLHPGYYTEYGKIWREKNREKRLRDGKQYYWANYDRIKEYRATHNREIRIRILQIVGKGIVKCANCPCDDIRLLEINHINGGGTKEIKGHNRFYYHILKGKRKIEDLEIRCRVCNALHYVETKYGKLPYRISYKKGR